MEYESKSFLTSKAIWGSLIVIAAQGARMAGYDLGPEEWQGLANDLATLFGAALAIYGRVKAVKRIG